MLGVKDCIKEIKKNRELEKSLLLMLDFDGTISPVVKLPENAIVPRPIIDMLCSLANFCKVAIVSGRPMGFVLSKIKNAKFSYVGSHGLEYIINGQKEEILLQKKVKIFLEDIKITLKQLGQKYQKLIVEEKPNSINLHYKFVKGSKLKSFLLEINEFLDKMEKSGKMRILRDKETIEILPNSACNKGFAIKKLSKVFGANYVPVYVGDAKTDEDAFEALENNGITVRVGKSKNSRAKYFLKNQKEINKFLKYILDIYESKTNFSNSPSARKA